MNFLGWPNNLTVAEKYAVARLEELKRNGPRTLVFDYDGTVYSRASNYDHQTAFSFFISILKKGITVGVITSRLATFEKILAPYLSQIKKSKSSFFIGQANGSQLTLIKGNKDRQILYQNNFSDVQLRELATKVNELLRNEKLSPKGIKIIKGMLAENWQRYINPKLINLAVGFNGLMYIEQAKISFVLPKNKTKSRELIGFLRKKLGDEVAIVAGDNTFGHITKKLVQDGKLLSLRTMEKYLKIDCSRVGVFGDMPGEGNDGAMLAGAEFGFTNDFNYRGDFKTSPFLLPRSEPAVKSVYQAVFFLLGDYGKSYC